MLSSYVVSIPVFFVLFKELFFNTYSSSNTDFDQRVVFSNAFINLLKMTLYPKSTSDRWTDGWTDGRMDGWMDGLHPNFQILISM